MFDSVVEEFQFTPPYEGATVEALRSYILFRFQSTPPCEGAMRQ